MGERKWRESIVTELLGPLYMQFRRTKTAFGEYRKAQTSREVTILYEGNSTIRRLFLEKAHLIPPELLEEAALLVDHLDRWMVEYDSAKRGPDGAFTAFIFAGPKGFGFPRDAERHFLDAFERYSLELRDEEMQFKASRLTAR